MKLLKVDFSPKEYRRFFKKISVDTENGCWNWVGGKDWGGYGQGFYRGRRERVHRIIYAFLVKPIPRGKLYHLDHICRNTSCCNPAHLKLVSHKENVIRGVGITAQNARKTQCKHGHSLPLYAGEKRRCCKTCDSIRHKKRMLGEQRAYWLNKQNEASKRWYYRHRY